MLQKKSRSFGKLTPVQNVQLRLSEKHKSLYSYIRLVVLKSTPLSFIKDREFRRFYKHKIVISTKSFKKTLLNLVKIV